MNSEIEQQIRKNVLWNALPAHIQQNLGNSKSEYEKLILLYSIKNQLRYKGNIVKTVRKDERRYYEDLLKYGRDHLMLYPYHLSDVMVKGLRITEFSYYISIMNDIMVQEKSYDSLPNFTAADCLRLMGIGRNQYIDIMNQCRSSKKFFRKKPAKDLLPAQPIDSIVIESWWIVQIGYVVEDDIKVCTTEEKKVIDLIIDKGPQMAGHMNFKIIHRLYRRGLVYLDVPITDDDHIIVPPLEGFVMNRVLGDYFETLLYKIFVSIDEHTSIAELANVLEIDLQLVKNAVSVFCRLGFAKRKATESSLEGLDESWVNLEQTNIITKKPTQEQLLIDWTTTINELNSPTPSVVSPDSVSLEGSEAAGLLNSGHSKRIALLFDSTLTAFLMMGNLSVGLKSHAVTMFEVGKLNDESLDSFLGELEKINTVGEGEAQRYFDHAVTLRDTIRFLRNNSGLVSDGEAGGSGQGLDLLRCESLLGLDPGTCSRILNKNYTLLISVAPLSNEIRPVSSSSPPHLGPAIPEVNSIWFKLFIYHITGNGPPSALIVKGSKLRRLPRVFREYDRLLVTTWGHDPAVISTSNILLTLNDALTHSPVLIQAHGYRQQDGKTFQVPFPLITDDSTVGAGGEHFELHSAVQQLGEVVDLSHSCGYITMLCTGKKNISSAPSRGEGLDQCKGEGKVYRQEGGGGFSPDTESLKDVAGAQSDDKQAGGATGTADKPGADRTDLSLDITADSSSVKGLKIDGGRLEEDWVLLDCCFGIPLFDANANQQICKRIISQELCNKDSLKELVSTNKKLAAELLKFVSQNQESHEAMEESFEVSFLLTGSSPQQPSVPLPTHNLIFCHGKLSVWNGL